MTETTDTALTAVQRKFVLHWGEMGNRWGINRTMAQIHALLYLCPRPLHAEEVCAILQVARSNVSTAMRELQGWGIVRVVHVLGDRRDHFESLKDPWEMFRIVLEERKRREIDPTVELLAACLAEAEKAGPEEAHSRERLAALYDFFSTMTSWYQGMNTLPDKALRAFVKLGPKVGRFFKL